MKSVIKHPGEGDPEPTRMRVAKNLGKRSKSLQQSSFVLVKRIGFGDTFKHRVGFGVLGRQQLTRMRIAGFPTYP